MSDVSFQTQISCVLEALVKVAEVELTKVFQKHCLASLTRVTTEDGCCEHPGVTFKRPGETCRSIGVQVDEETSAWEQQTLSGLGSDCLKEGTEVEDIPLVEADEYADLEEPVLKEKDEEKPVSSETTKSSETTSKEPKTCDPAGDVQSSGVVLSLSAKLGRRSRQAKLQNGSRQTKVQNGSDAQSLDNHTAPQCKAEKQAPAPQQLPHIEEPGQVEPQQASVSTAQGTAYSPSPSDCAVASLRVSLWDRLASVKNTVNQQRETPVPQENKLLRPCSVQLVNLSLVESGGKTPGGDDAMFKVGFQTPRDLRIHQGIHTGRRLCCFTKCGNGVWRLQGVLAHRHSHCCETCGKRFKRRKILRRHERFHTGEKPYRCPKCHKGFALRKSLRRHQRFHTGERPYTCTQCAKSFRLRENLKAHLRFHTGEKPFTCPLCTKSFRIYRNLEKHNITHF